MRKLFMIFSILHFSLMAGQHPTSTGTDPMEYYSPVSYKLSNISDDLSTSSSKIVKKQYAYFGAFMAQKDVKAKDVFTEEQMQILALEPDTEILFDEINLGILVSSGDRILFVVPEKIQYAGLSMRDIR